MILLVNSGLILEGEIKIKSSYFFTSLNSSWVIGPIIILTSCDLISLIAALSFSLLFNPESLGTMKTFLSSISSSASCREYKRELPSSLYAPLNGASRPTYKIFSFSSLKRLELKKIII